MRRLLPLVLLLALLPSGAADAEEAVTCQGREATLVSDGAVSGTEGDDVIVAGGHVRAGGGDDVVCTSGLFVDAGAGDDSVVADDAATVTTAVRMVVLGPGHDRYLGGAGPDRVFHWTLNEVYGEDLDRGDDVVVTGGGVDVVDVGSAYGTAQGDRVDTGAGDDRVLVATSGLTPAGAIEGGDGVDSLEFESNDGRRAVARLDLATRGLAFDGIPFVPRWHGIERVELLLRGARVAEVRGTPGADEVLVTGTVRLDVGLGAGADLLATRRTTSGRIDLGGGRDLLRVLVGGAQVDLPRGLFTAGRQRTRLSGVEDVGGVPGLVRGDGRRNTITVSCGRVLAGGGDDVVRDVPRPSGCRNGARIDGGPGDDLLVGGAGPDVLDGGPGRDRADGRAARDACVAERRVRCER